MKIAIYAKIYENETLDYVMELLDECSNVGAKVSIESDFYAQLSASRKIGQYAKSFEAGNRLGIQPFIAAANAAHELGLGINAGHDLSLDNIKYFKENIPHLLEVSIGHALICESLYLGMENVIKMYLHKLR